MRRLSSIDWRAWPLRISWLVLPLLLGPQLADALSTRDSLFRRATSIALWAVWSLTLVATAVARPLTLTAVRIVAPATIVVSVWSAVADRWDSEAVVGLAAAVAVTSIALAVHTGDAFVDGASYGNERRFLLRPPAVFLLGPIELLWATTVAGLAAGPLLLFARHWIAGSVLTVAGFAVASFTARALHALSRRWLVFVPGGVVIHDHLALGEPTLFPRVAALGPATAAIAAVDLTVNTYGLTLMLQLREPQTVVPPGRRVREPYSLTSLLFAPSRPGAVMAEARRRHLG